MLEWSAKRFAELVPGELYEILALRQQVFVVEQRCAYLDCDGRDLAATHLLGRGDDHGLVAYARLLPGHVAYEEPSIGRVVTAPSGRGRGYGRELLREAVRRTWEAFGGPILIGAQSYLERFYRDEGFLPVGEPYEEDGIPHIHMRFSRP